MVAKRVLVIDDSAELRALCRRALERAGHEVACAADGEEGVAQFRRGPPFDIVLTDVQMPKLDGFDLVRALRDAEAETAARACDTAQQRRRPVKILVMSGGGSGAGRLAADYGARLSQALGVEGFLCKPFSPAELQARIAIL